MLQASGRWYASIRDRRIPLLEVGLPQWGEFDGGLLPPEYGLEVFWRCLDSDGAEMARRAQALAARIKGQERLRITDDRGTDLAVEPCPDSAPLIGDGVVSEDDLAGGRNFESVPAGTVTYLPRRGSANGRLFAPYVFAAGRRFEDVSFEVRDGEIVGFTSDEDLTVLEEALDKAEGEPRTLAEYGIGLNPGGQELTGKPVLDACLQGATTVAFGNNEHAGGDVRSTLTLILPAIDRTVRTEPEGAVLVEKGKLR